MRHISENNNILFVYPNLIIFGVKAMDGFSIVIDEVVIDCADAKKLADFYAGLLGWNISEVGEDWLVVSSPGYPLLLLFQQEEDYIAPVWPESAEAQQKSMHLDFHVSDLDKAVQHAVSLGATVTKQQFSPMKWITMLDPAGHPFCLCLAE
jgi:predicted enzyme related to lactoylglutathione lyase